MTSNFIQYEGEQVLRLTEYDVRSLSNKSPYFEDRFDDSQVRIYKPQWSGRTTKNILRISRNQPLQLDSGEHLMDLLLAAEEVLMIDWTRSVMMAIVLSVARQSPCFEPFDGANVSVRLTLVKNTYPPAIESSFADHMAWLDCQLSDVRSGWAATSQTIRIISREGRLEQTAENNFYGDSSCDAEAEHTLKLMETMNAIILFLLLLTTACQLSEEIAKSMKYLFILLALSLPLIRPMLPSFTSNKLQRKGSHVKLVLDRR